MFAIDDPTAVAVMPTPEAAGTAGFWTEGNPGLGQAATLMRASFFNGLQQELLNILSAAGIAPNKTNYTQLLTALRAAGVFTTPPQFDDSTKAATTAFVRRAIGSYAGAKNVSVPYTVTAADAGFLIVASGTGNVTVPSNIFPPGVGCIISAGVAGDNITVLPPGGGSFSYGGAGKSSIVLANNENVSIISQGLASTTYIVNSGGLRSSDDFLHSPSGNGYQRLPSGIMVQWGTANGSASADVAVTYPIAFTSGGWSVTANIISAITGYVVATNSVGLTGFSFGTWGNSTTRAAATIMWMAIGK